MPPIPPVTGTPSATMDRYGIPGCHAFQEVEVESMEPMSVQTTGGMAAGWGAQVIL